jgi:hypothetical protein
MDPLGTKVLAHHKPHQHLSWGFHALNTWYISPSLRHYQCIKIIMHDIGGERIMDMFRYKHHAVPVPVVTATDCILKATHQLTAAIEGVQEAAPDKLQAVESLRHILLGKRILQQPCPPPSTPLNDSNVNKEPIHIIWDLTIRAQPICPPMQPKGHLKVSVPSLTLMTSHLTLFLQYIRAALPSLTMMTMHHQQSDAHGVELNCTLERNPISSIW